MSGDQTMSIGALAKATGVPVETIRTWERRYGFPRSKRNASGHRLYGLGAVQHLRLVTQALASGHRPSQLAGHDTEELERLVEVTAETGGSEQWMQEWIEASRGMERRRLERYMSTALLELGALPFIQERIEPFMVEIGELWQRKDLGVVHEHFVSECVRDFLVKQWRPLQTLATGPKVVCATLPKEHHSLGLHTVALAASLIRFEVVFLGANTPVEDIARAATETGAACVLMSVSLLGERLGARASITAVRDLLEIPLGVGGAGAPLKIPGVQDIGDIAELYAFLQNLTRRHR